MYIFDTSPLSELFRSYYRGRFPTLWGKLEALIANGKVSSTREVKNELERYGRADENWIRNNSAIFTTPTAHEANFVKRIYAVRHFQQNIELKKIHKGGFNADPFVVAKAAVNKGIVVTLESIPKNGVRVPNICKHFNIECCNLEDFMEAEGWVF